MIIVLAVEPGHEGVSGRSTATRIMIEDLLSLITYFEQHIQKLKEDSNKNNIFSTHNTPTSRLKLCQAMLYQKMKDMLIFGLGLM